MDAQEYIGKMAEPTAAIDFGDMEKSPGFAVHGKLKEFYRTVGEDALFGAIHFRQLPHAEQWGDWFENENDPLIGISLYGTKGYVEPPLFYSDGTPVPEEIDEEAEEDRANYDFAAEFVNSFYCREPQYKGFGQRMIIGVIDDNMGRDGLNVLFDNETGFVEWSDTEWGDNRDYNDVPHGILAHSIDELLRLMKEARQC